MSQPNPNPSWASLLQRPSPSISSAPSPQRSEPPVSSASSNRTDSGSATNHPPPLPGVDVASNNKHFEAAAGQSPARPSPRVAMVSGHMDLTPDEFAGAYHAPLDEALARGDAFVMGDAKGVDETALEYILAKGGASAAGRVTVYASRPANVDKLQRLGVHVVLAEMHSDLAAGDGAASSSSRGRRGRGQGRGGGRGGGRQRHLRRDEMMTEKSDYDILYVRSEAESRALYGDKYRPRVSATELNRQRRAAVSAKQGRDSGINDSAADAEAKTPPPMALDELLSWPRPLSKRKKRYFTPESDEDDEFVLLDPKRQKTGPDVDVFDDDDDDDDVFGQGGDLDDEFEGIDSIPDETDKIQKRLKESFGNPCGDFTFQRVIGSGSNGVAVLIHDNRVYPPKRLILKRALREDDFFQMEQELRTLKLFRGAAHIVQMVGSRDLRTFEDADLAGPAIVMEYLENGSFNRFLEKHNAMEGRVPNRVLWSIMLCLMFGDIEPGSTEHALVPRVKLIDFGTATPNPVQGILDDTDNMNPNQGDHSNVNKCAEAVMRLITRRNGRLPTYKEKPASYSGVPTDATLLWPDVETDTDETYPWLDRGLRRLLGRMMARNYKDCPLLEDILREASLAVRRGARDYPGHEAEESDEACGRFIKQCFYDAHPGAGAGGGDDDDDVFFDAGEGWGRWDREVTPDVMGTGEEQTGGGASTPPFWSPISPPKTGRPSS
ncbi:uncharacterized protein PG986_002449 [Apiospora aurea]|uniref:Protein kinase domain-containing protein n=1 Tax=Apiospora aurea TaxID=335848 RepID=A0ABR1QNV0_9PEZI